jgi:hypothetical protein
MNVTNKLVVSLLAGIALSVAAAGTAAADSKCENVKLSVTNKYTKSGDNKDINVVDLEYWDADDGKWRDESTDNKKIGWGDNAVWTKNLEYVGGESGVKLKLHYKYNTGGTSWSGTLYVTSAAFKCIDGVTVPLTIQ